MTDTKFTEEWTVVGRKFCPWCTQVQQLLKAHGIEYRYYNVYDDDGLYIWFQEQGLKTVPQVFHNGIRIGGYEDTERYLKGLNS